MASSLKKRSVAVVGYGSLGQFLVHKILTDPKTVAQFELAWVWNRSFEKLEAEEIPSHCKLKDLSDALPPCDLIVEVSHPEITKAWGAKFLKHADFYIGSPTALADRALEAELRAAAMESGHGLYVPAGALWGAVDIAKMADRNSLGGLCITMKKHPESLKLEGALQAKLEALLADKAKPAGEHLLFEGSVRDLCPMAPNNVNTMAAAAVAAHTLGFDGVQARLVADFALETHVIEIEVSGKPLADGSVFQCKTNRVNPAPPGAVTGTATYASFHSSLFFAQGKGAGMHLC